MEFGILKYILNLIPPLENSRTKMFAKKTEKIFQNFKNNKNMRNKLNIERMNEDIIS